MDEVSKVRALAVEAVLKRRSMRSRTGLVSELSNGVERRSFVFVPGSCKIKWIHAVCTWVAPARG